MTTGPSPAISCTSFGLGEAITASACRGLADVQDMDPALLRRLKTAILAGPRFNASEADIAGELGLSARTLRRRLYELNTSYAGTLARVRFAFARHCLADGRLTIAEVADRVGYTEASNFRVAFKRWANCSPQEFRDSLGIHNGEGGIPNREDGT